MGHAWKTHWWLNDVLRLDLRPLWWYNSDPKKAALAPPSKWREKVLVKLLCNCPPWISLKMMSLHFWSKLEPNWWNDNLQNLLLMSGKWKSTSRRNTLNGTWFWPTFGWKHVITCFYLLPIKLQVNLGNCPFPYVGSAGSTHLEFRLFACPHLHVPCYICGARVNSWKNHDHFRSMGSGPSKQFFPIAIKTSNQKTLGNWKPQLDCSPTVSKHLSALKPNPLGPWTNDSAASCKTPANVLNVFPGYTPQKFMAGTPQKIGGL